MKEMLVLRSLGAGGLVLRSLGAGGLVLRSLGEGGFYFAATIYGAIS